MEVSSAAGFEMNLFVKFRILTILLKPFKWQDVYWGVSSVIRLGGGHLFLRLFHSYRFQNAWFKFIHGYESDIVSKVSTSKRLKTANAAFIAFTRYALHDNVLGGSHSGQISALRTKSTRRHHYLLIQVSLHSLRVWLSSNLWARSLKAQFFWPQST